MKYPIATEYDDLVDDPREKLRDAESQERIDERRALAERQFELWEKDRAEQGFFRNVDDPSDEALNFLIEEECNLLRRRLKMAQYNASTKHYELDPDAFEKENRFQRIARLADRQFYHDERIENAAKIKYGFGYEEHSKLAVEEAKNAVTDVIYDLCSMVFALKMCAKKSLNGNEWIYDEILQVLDKKLTEVQTTPSTYTTQFGFNSFQHLPATSTGAINGLGSKYSSASITSVIYNPGSFTPIPSSGTAKASQKAVYATKKAAVPSKMKRRRSGLAKVISKLK